MPHDKAKPDSADDQPKKNLEGDEIPEMITHPSYEELLQKLDEAEQKSNQYWERMLRMQADIDNAARRHDRDVASAHKYALEKFAAELLPIIDSLELCLHNTAATGESPAAAVIEGVQLTFKMFRSAMEKFGIQQIDPVSEAFNPEFHQAISTEVSAKHTPGTVISVLQKGYLLNNRLIRPALVVVAKS